MVFRLPENPTENDFKRYKILEQKRNYYKRNLEKMREWRKNNSEKIKINNQLPQTKLSKQRWKEENREKYLAGMRKCNSRKSLVNT
jgi:hypothetical protein